MGSGCVEIASLTKGISLLRDDCRHGKHMFARFDIVIAGWWRGICVFCKIIVVRVNQYHERGVDTLGQQRDERCKDGELER